MYGNRMNVILCKIVGVLRIALEMMSMCKTRHNYMIQREYGTKEGTKRICSEKGDAKHFTCYYYVYNRNDG